MNAEQLQELFSSNLKEMRIRANLSQMKLAEKADLSVGYICDLESGRRWGTPETFSKLARALDVNPFELLLPKDFELSASEISFRRTFAAEVNKAIQNNLRSALDNAISQAMNNSLNSNSCTF